MSTISSITPNLTTPTNWQSLFQQQRQDLNQLRQALDSGDLSAAEQAYQNLASLQSSSQIPAAGGASSSANTLQNDFTQLGRGSGTNVNLAG